MQTNTKQAKLERITAALHNKMPDRLPISDFFWTGFMNRGREAFGPAFDPYREFDLDYVVVNPNMDPTIMDFEVLEELGGDILVKTGFGATIRRRGDLPMPHFEGFSVNEPEEMSSFTFEPADDPRRLFRNGADQINCLGDALSMSVPSWDKRVESYYEDFPVFGSVCEPYELCWRCIGTENSLIWMLSDEELFAGFISRIQVFVTGLLKAQIAASRGRLSGIYIWGDVAYRNGMLFSPAIWRKYFKPAVRELIEIAHEAGLLVIYHGCGNASPIYEDFIEIGLNGYNPLEAKADLDIVKLKEQYGGRLCFVGNYDVREMESGDPIRIKKQFLYKLQAALNGGWILQSDHSVTSGVSPASYALVRSLVDEYGEYPLNMERIQNDLAAL